MCTGLCMHPASYDLNGFAAEVHQTQKKKNRNELQILNVRPHLEEIVFIHVCGQEKKNMEIKSGHRLVKPGTLKL